MLAPHNKGRVTLKMYTPVEQGVKTLFFYEQADLYA